MIEKLLGYIDESVIAEIDIDEFLDIREEELFDQEWCRVYFEVEERKDNGEYQTKSEKQGEELQKKAYKKIYNVTKDDEFASYVSDDVRLIFDCNELGYEDPWLQKLVSSYENKISLKNL